MDMGKYVIFLSIFLVSCSNTIDFVPTDSYNEIAVWENEQSVNLYINSFYRIFNEYFIFGNKPIGGDATMSDGLTDLAKYSSNSPGEGTANLIMTQDGIDEFLNFWTIFKNIILNFRNLFVCEWRQRSDFLELISFF